MLDACLLMRLQFEPTRLSPRASMTLALRCLPMAFSLASKLEAAFQTPPRTPWLLSAQPAFYVTPQKAACDLLLDRSDLKDHGAAPFSPSN